MSSKNESGSATEPVVAIIDVETTGTIPERDRVIEFAVQRGLAPGEYNQSWRINPGIPIPPGSTAIHGITDADVKDCPDFSALIPVIKKILEGADIVVGYNLDFDLNCLEAEFKRKKAQWVDISKKILMDPLKIWRHFEPRKLSDALRRFANEEHSSAHTAGGDVAATGKVLAGMMTAFGIGHLSWKELQNVMTPGRESWVGPSSHLRWEGEEIVVNFGKHTGKGIREALEIDKGYGDWILSKDFPSHVKEIINEATAKSSEDFNKWAIEKYNAS